MKSRESEEHADVNRKLLCIFLTYISFCSREKQPHVTPIPSPHTNIKVNNKSRMRRKNHTKFYKNYKKISFHFHEN